MNKKWFLEWLLRMLNIIPTTMMGMAACQDVEPGYLVVFHHPCEPIDTELLGSDEEPFWINAVRKGVPASTKLDVNSQKITAVAVDPESNGAMGVTIDALAKNGYGCLWLWKTIFIKK